MSYLFPPSRSLLYPQFETYRLHSLDPDVHVTSYPLPGNGATQSRLGYNEHQLSFKETRARIAWDHLCVSGRRGVYVDTDWAVIGFTLNDDLQPVFTTLANFPTPISSSTVSSPAPEYPSVRALDSTHWTISTGSGSLYILETSSPTSEQFTGELTAMYERPYPFLLQAAHLSSPSKALLLFSRSVPEVGKDKARPKTATYEVLEVAIDPTKRTNVDSGSVESLDVRWAVRGGDLPYWCTWWDQGWLIFASEEIGGEDSVSEPGSQDSKGKKKVEPSKLVLGVGEDGSNGENGQSAPHINEITEEKAWPFTWTQGEDSVSMSIPLPTGTKREDVEVGLTATELRLVVSTSSVQPAPPLQDFLRKEQRRFWTTIDVEESTFTFDAAQGRLDIELSKVDTHTRWPSIFLPSDDDDDEEEVPETISASTLAAVRETFNNIKTRSPDEPEGAHPAIPTMIQEEMDLDDDADDAPERAFGNLGGGKVGREVYLGYIKDGKANWTKTTSVVLSLPLLANRDDGVIIKSAVDGLSFTPEPGPDPIKTPWTHISTNPALSFVLSSKRDLRLVRHLTKTSISADAHSPKRPRTEHSTSAATTVFAFDSGTSSTLTGNAYIYYPASTTTTARQGVIRVSGAERGAVLGVGCISAGDEDVVIALCEKELVIMGGCL
ncbi:hypothetical protein BCR39DRAFT_464431 [Naematelia encephala]|uniref:NudC domain-containing protein 1 n=1 Tax=Naematelia encephala TaxID=71784 RepID=A0A1Y2BEL4_9TREE|nr:hypothetical protein BCR39DRAFT_464431 [Naematelia encephala]